MKASKVVVEWAPFELVAGVDEDTLLQASAAFQREFVSKQNGFIRRELLKGQGNQWVDLVYWESMADAEQVAKNAANNLVCHAYFQLMVTADHDNPAAGVLHFEQMSTYSPEAIASQDRVPS